MAHTVANTILSQLGGRRFVAMTGAKNLLSSDRSLSMRLPNAAYEGRKVSALRVILDPSDTYTVEALFIRGTTVRTVTKLSDVYWDQLQDVFTSLTGLVTSL